MVNCLAKARQEDRFVPWEYIFCDYSVTGLDASRQGYSSYKAVLTDPDHLIETTYIDDFTRASRDEIEWWRLAALSKRYRKRLIGASDSFDLSSPNSDLLITMFGLVSRIFIKGLREKVRRGMRGAARRGTVLGKLPLGFTRKVHRDKNGNVVYRPDGRPRHEPCVDPKTQKHRELMFRLFYEKHWTPYRIARYFNDHKIDGWDGRTEKGVRRLLIGLDAMGIFIWNRYRREYDLEQDKHVLVENPRSEWVVYVDPSLRIVPVKWWGYARRKLRNTWDKKSNAPKLTRNQMSATTLFSGTLICESCDAEIKLIRSDGKYRQMGCLNGARHAHDCKQSTSKSVQVIEECLVDFIRENLLTEAIVAELITRANIFFEKEARKPEIDTGPMKAEVRKIKADIKKYQTFIEKEPDEELCWSHNSRIRELQAMLNDRQEQIRNAERKNRRSLKPLDVERCKHLVPDLRELSAQEVGMAAESIRLLTGPIKIRQEQVPGKRGGRWIAKFSPDLAALLRRVAQQTGNPDAKGLAAIPSEPQEVGVVTYKVPKYERLAPMFKQMRDNGASVQSIAAAHGVTWQFATQVLHFADTGERPKWKTGKPTGAGATTPKYKEISKEVAYLRDKKKMSIVQIAAKLGVA